jgi:hypothetical protein
VAWNVEFTEEFEAWWKTLDDGEQDAVARLVSLLEEYGPTLPFPYSSGVEGSEYSHMRELRVQHAGRPYRVLYAFDPRSVALLLIGGDKSGQDRWYEQYVRIADRIYTTHLREIKGEMKKEGEGKHG